MTPSEVAFLALGLVLGLASGAALIEVLRAKPPASREVRVTVAPNAIQARFPSTLADPLASTEASGPARGGPADQHWHEDPSEVDAATVARRLGLATGANTAEVGTPVPSHPNIERPDPMWLSPSARGGTTMVPVPMALEPDPLTAALRSTAAGSAAKVLVGGPPAVIPLAGNPYRDAIEARQSAAGGRPGGPGLNVSESTTSAPGRRGAAIAQPADSTRAASAPPTRSERPRRETPPSGPVDAGGGSPSDARPCAEERRIAEERCAVATRAREGATTAADALRSAQRAYDENAAAGDTASAAADPRAVRTAKETAQQQFRTARARAGTRDDVEAAARDWLAEINRINVETREAISIAEKRRNAAAALAASLERLAVEADAARISSERAEEACIAAREGVAACDEGLALEAAASRAPSAPPADGRGARQPLGSAATGSSMGLGDDELIGDDGTGSQAGHDAAILRILRGDREAMQRAVARLAADDPDGGRQWQVLLSGLADALVARAIEAAAFDFPVDHFFWGAFSQAENRDIAAALSSLGFRFDGFGGWVDDHVPAQRDLSLAVGYAGQDPMRIRHWPNEPEMQALLSDVRVAADDYVASAAGGLTLGELVTLLGRRADPLTELWNAWGRVRPVLLEAS